MCVCIYIYFYCFSPPTFSDVAFDYLENESKLFRDNDKDAHRYDIIIISYSIINHNLFITLIEFIDPTWPIITVRCPSYRWSCNLRCYR